MLTVPSEFLIVAEQVLMNIKEPMRPHDIVNYAVENDLFSKNIAGKTPHQTLKSKLSQEIRKRGDTCKFVRVRPGVFHLRSLLDDSAEIYEAKPYRKPLPVERVLVVPTPTLERIGSFQGIRTSWTKYYDELLHPDNCFFMDRMAAEQNDAHKQLLTYIFVTKGNELLAFRRGIHNRAEDFLKGSECIGFGGHVVEEDQLLLPESHNVS